MSPRVEQSTDFAPFRSLAFGLVLAVLLALLLSTGACASSGGQGTSAATKPVAVPATAPTKRGPLADFAGKWITLGAQAELDEFAYGVASAGIILKLFRINEQEYTEGEKTTVSTQAEINVIKGEVQKRLLIPEGEGRWAFGCKINVKKARVAYLEKRQDWLPRATVVVNCK